MTLPLLSETFGAGVGFFTLGCWFAGLGGVLTLMHQRLAGAQELRAGFWTLITMIMVLGPPIITARALAAASSKCDELRARLDKRIDDPSLHGEIAGLEQGPREAEPWPGARLRR